MKALFAAALLALALAGAVQAETSRQAAFEAKMLQQQKQSIRTKVGIQPRSRDEVRADRMAKAEREARVKQASQETHRRHEAAFAEADADRNGRIDLDEFKEAALHLEGARKSNLP
jgi:hypothetical protein